MVKIAGKSGEKILAPRRQPDVAAVVEGCVGCKWTLRVLAEVRRGVNRPGALVRALPGLTPKVLNERLTKLVRYDVLERVSYPEVPPRVEYQFTEFGLRLAGILDEIERLKGDLVNEGEG